MTDFAGELANVQHAPAEYERLLQQYASEAGQDLQTMKNTFADVRNTDLSKLQVSITNFVTAEVYNWLKDAPAPIRDVFAVAASALEGALSGFAAVEFVSTATIFAVTGLGTLGLSTAAGSVGAEALGWAAGLTAAGGSTMGAGAVIGCLIAAGVAIAELIDWSKPATYSSPQDCYNRMTVEQQAYFTYMQKVANASGAGLLAHWWASDFQNVPNRKSLWVFSSYNDGFGYAPLGFAFCDRSGWNGLFYHSGRVVPETSDGSPDGGTFYPPYAWGLAAVTPWQAPRAALIRFIQSTFRVTTDQATRMAQTAYWRLPPMALWYAFIKEVNPAAYDDRTGAQTTNLDTRGYALEQFALLAMHAASPAEFAALADTLLDRFRAAPGIGKEEEPAKVRAMTAIREYYLHVKSSWEHFDFGGSGAGVAPPSLAYQRAPPPPPMTAAEYAAANAGSGASARAGNWQSEVATAIDPHAAMGGEVVFQQMRLAKMLAIETASKKTSAPAKVAITPAVRGVSTAALFLLGAKFLLWSSRGRK